MTKQTKYVTGGHLFSRRGFLGSMAGGLSGISLAHLLDRDGLLAAEGPIAPGGKVSIRPDVDPRVPLAARPTHFPARAKRVIMIFCAGAVSQMDTFDYKPELIARHGQPLPGGKELITFQGRQGSLTQPLWRFRPYGQCGKMVSDLVPQIGELADDLCFLHSLTTKTNTHGPGENVMSTGFVLDGFPGIGAWTSYALGSDCEDLPAFVAIPDPRGGPPMAGNNWGSGFLPAVFQGTDFNAIRPVQNLHRPESISPAADLAWRDHLQRINQRHLQRFPGDSQLAARISSYEMAARMQLSIPAVTDLRSEPAHILKLYGADDRENELKAGFARNCILARRLVEQGVRFVQLFNGSYHQGGEGVSNWDGHKNIKPQYDVHGAILDQPVAGLVKDLKQRGLLEDTLVLWTTEFGRMPTFQLGAEGRDHNPNGFTVWMAGAGVKAPYSYGATDELSYKAVQNACTVHDFHATVLHLLGLDHERLTYYHNGIQRRLTDVHGHVIHEVVENKG